MSKHLDFPSAGSTKLYGINRFNFFKGGASIRDRRKLASVNEPSFSSQRREKWKSGPKKSQIGLFHLNWIEIGSNFSTFGDKSEKKIPNGDWKKVNQEIVLLAA